MVKAVNLTFCSIKYLFTENIHAKFGIPSLSQSPDIGNNSDVGISNFRILGQIIYNRNCHSSRTSNDIDMKLGPITKLGTTNITISKNFEDGVMFANYDVIVIFPIDTSFGAIRNSDFGHMVCN